MDLTVIKTAQKLEQAGQFKAAAQLYSDLLKEHPNNYAVLRFLVFALANYDRPRAVEEIETFCKNNKNSWDLSANALALAMPYRESIARRKQGLPEYSDTTVYNLPFTLETKQLHRWIYHTSRWLEEDYTNPKAIALTAATEFVQGNYRACQNLLDQVRDAVDLRVRNVHFMGQFFDQPVGDNWKRLPKPVYVRHCTGPRTIFFCDEWFYKRFGENLVKTYAKSETSGHLHVHAFRDSDYMRKSMLKHLGENHGYSYEDVPDVMFNKFYFATIRPFRIWQLMQENPVMTVHLDADVFVGRSMDDLFDRLKIEDVALCRMPGRIPYHSQTNATIFGFNLSEKGISFAKKVADYVLRCYNNYPIAWYNEQTALNISRIVSMDQEKIIAVGPKIYNGDYEGCVWPQKVPVDSENYELWKGVMEDAKGT